MTTGLLAYPGEWWREERGLGVEVAGLTADAVECAISSLPEAWAPYRLLADTKRKEGEHYVEVRESPRQASWMTEPLKASGTTFCGAHRSHQN